MTLFSRLVAGYLAILVVVMAVSAYAIYQLHHLNGIAHSLLQIDRQILEYEEKLRDNLLSQIRYEKKFLISQDQTLYDQFVLFHGDFRRHLEEIGGIADSDLDPRLQVIREQHRIYAVRLEEEAGYLKSRRLYPVVQYREEKDKIAERILAELDAVKAYGRRNSYDKLTGLAQTVANARRMAIGMTGTSLLFVFVVSLVITRSISRPVSLLKRKTSEIARGNFDTAVEIASPPEIAELATAFNLMCHKLKDLDKMKSDFFSSMSHDLRTPLTSIKEGTSLLLDGVGGAVTDKQKKILHILAEESSRLIAMVNSLLDLAKMEAGMMTYAFAPWSLSALIRRATTEIGPLMEAKKIILETSVSEDLPVLNLDSERILQALRNLIANAVKFAPEGGHVRVTARPTDRGVEVSVADNGPGIPPESLSTIFEKFRQAAPTANGSGLGLAIVKHIVTSHGGQVWAESKVGKGSTFVFVLPA